MWKPSEVVAQSRRRAVAVWSLLIVAITAYTGWLLYRAAEKTTTPDTSFQLTNVVYKYPDLWICLYDQFGCDDKGIEAECVKSAWETDLGGPEALFYPKEKLNDTTDSNATTTDRPITVTYNFNDTSDSDDDNKEQDRGNCVVFETSAVDDFLGEERDPNEHLDYILLDMYWYPGGTAGHSTTCVPDGEEWESHREWVYGFLADPDDPAAVSTGIQLSYSCITDASDSHIFNHVGIGLTDQHKYMAKDVSSYNAISTNFGIHKDKVDSSIEHPYARLSLELKQQFNSWEIITEANPFEIAEMFGNIGGFWDLLLILWPIFFVAATQEEPRLKPRNFRKSIVRGAERAAGITKVVAVTAPLRRSASVGAAGGASGASSLEAGLAQEERPPWEPPTFGRKTSCPQRSVFASNSSRALQRGD